MGATSQRGFAVNRKRVQRLWRLEGHRVPPRRRQASGKKAQTTTPATAGSYAIGISFPGDAIYAATSDRATPAVG